MQYFLINLYYNILSMKDSIHSALGTVLSRLFASAGELSFFLQYAQKPGEHQMSTRCDKILYFTLIVILMVFFVPFFKVTTALTVAVPAFTAVIVPFLLTVAMDFLDVA